MFFVIPEGLELIFDVFGIFRAVQKSGFVWVRIRTPGPGISWVKDRVNSLIFEMFSIIEFEINPMVFYWNLDFGTVCV